MGKETVFNCTVNAIAWCYSMEIHDDGITSIFLITKEAFCFWETDLKMHYTQAHAQINPVVMKILPRGLPIFEKSSRV